MNNILQTTIFGLLIATVFTLPLEKNIAENQSENDVGEYGDYFEGDMKLNEEQLEELFSPARNGLIAMKYRWPNKTLPYQLTTDHTKEQRDRIELALKTMESVSCVKFVRRTNEEDYVELTAENSGCHSEVGLQRGKQILNLQKNHKCFRLATIMHEFLHALGFYHMQSAYDRDDFVTIHWQNIRSGLESNFNKYTNKEVTHFNTTYDYYSVMHYGAYGFSKNGEPTIVPVDKKYLNVIGQREKLSEKDIHKLNAMYECNHHIEV